MGARFSLAARSRRRARFCTAPIFLESFAWRSGLPVWRYRTNGVTIEKRLLAPHGQNTRIRPLPHPGRRRAGEADVAPVREFSAPRGAGQHALGKGYMLTVVEDRYEDHCPLFPPLRLILYGKGAALTIDRMRIQEIDYPVEGSRGYEARGDLWSPGLSSSVNWFAAAMPRWLRPLNPGKSYEALSPEEAWDAEYDRRGRLLEEAEPSAHHGPAAELVLAADQFIITPSRTCRRHCPRARRRRRSAHRLSPDTTGSPTGAATP